MKTLTRLLFFVCFLFSIQTKSQQRVVINIPSVVAESEYVWRTIQDINFFEANNYDVSLPKGSLIDELIVKTKSGTLVDADYTRLERFMTDSVYNATDYQSGFQKIEGQLVLINKMISEISGLDLNWSFRLFDTYQINLTLYGPGGSYDPDRGTILIYCTPRGQFRSYDNPANTIIHEVTHIGIEESIINKFDVPHALKERIVDSFVLLNFTKDLPDYRIQDMGDYRIDQHLKSKMDLKKLDEYVMKVISHN